MVQGCARDVNSNAREQNTARCTHHQLGTLAYFDLRWQIGPGVRDASVEAPVFFVPLTMQSSCSVKAQVYPKNAKNDFIP